MKHEWKKVEKEYYLPPRKPVCITVPAMRFIEIDGEGDPNTEPYQQRLSALYALTWTLRMMDKQGFTPEGYYVYGVYPLEGIYDTAQSWEAGAPLDKQALTYTLMIRQPDFVTEPVYAWALRQAARKEQNPLLSATRLVDHTEGLCVQMTHTGPYDDEPASFAQMQTFCEANGLVRTGATHREIYISDPRRTAPENLKTVLRYPVRQA